MEVKIKDGNGYVEADWTIEDGVMVVSPKKVKFEPKDGDVVTAYQGNHIFILENHLTASHGDCYCGWNFITDKLFNRGSYYYNRYATSEEKQKLFDALKREGFVWNAEKMELVKIKWKPTEGECFWTPRYNTMLTMFKISEEAFSTDGDEHLLCKGWCFKAKEECQEFCDRLNEAISNVKP